jgi:hypothetical protein
MAGTSTPKHSGTSVTIRITGQVDIGAAAQKLASKLSVSNYSASHSGNRGEVTIGFGGELQTVIDAIDFGTVESFDLQKRELEVKIP